MQSQALWQKTGKMVKRAQKHWPTTPLTRRCIGPAPGKAALRNNTDKQTLHSKPTQADQARTQATAQQRCATRCTGEALTPTKRSLWHSAHTDGALTLHASCSGGAVGAALASWPLCVLRRRALKTHSRQHTAAKTLALGSCSHRWRGAGGIAACVLRRRRRGAAVAPAVGSGL